MRCGFLIFVGVVLISLSLVSLVFVAGQENLRDFELSVPLVKAVVELGDSVDTQISVVNLVGEREFSISVFSIDDFIKSDKKSFLLGKDRDERFSISLDSNDLSPGVYVGHVIVSNQYGERVVPVILEVESFGLLFDLNAELPSRFSRVSPGSEMIADMIIFNLRADNPTASLEYFVTDLEGVIVASGSQILNVRSRVEVSKELRLPDNLAFGDYVFYATISQGSSKGTSSLLFSVSEPARNVEIKASSGTMITISIAVIVFLILAFLVINYLWTKRLTKDAKDWRKKVSEIKRIRVGDVAKNVQKLEYQKNVLERAYKKGFIKRKSYEEGRREINKLLIKLKKRL